MGKNRTPVLIGRSAEIAVLEKAWQSDEAEMVAVIGRRRVGKTFLVRQCYADKIVFEMTGIKDGKISEQLRHFTDRLNHHARPDQPYKRPKNWQDAFELLTRWLETRTDSQKAVLFFDELPWLAGKRSDFIKSFGLFWNIWASQQHIVVVICGSAASWMITHVVRDKGGLHNRITRRILLKPFLLHETEQYLQHRGVHLDRYQLLELYMALGGIPHYLKEIEGGKTATESIDYICFSEQGLLREEFSELYAALFDNAHFHIHIIRTLATTWQGMSRTEIAEKTGLNDSGHLSNYLEELTHSGFITAFFAYGKKKKELRFRLTDAYSLFYLQFMENHRAAGRGSWMRLSQTQAWKSWSGYAFENICLQHIAQIKKALGIAGIHSEVSHFHLKNSAFGRGLQIDLLIDRQDKAINLFELKFYSTPFVLKKDLTEEIRLKKAIFKEATSTNKQLFYTLLAPFLPAQSAGVFDRMLDMNCLFEEAET
jgi:AAA+ ATPase superfamily predicted ATPase